MNGGESRGAGVPPHDEMNDSDKITMYLNIGGQRISLMVPFASQDFVREVEKGINVLYREWRHSFPMKTDREILAMVTYQYASFYEGQKKRYEAATRKAAECLATLGEESSAPAPQEADPEGSDPKFSNF